MRGEEQLADAIGHLRLAQVRHQTRILDARAPRGLAPAEGVQLPDEFASYSPQRTLLIASEGLQSVVKIMQDLGVVVFPAFSPSRPPL